MTSVREGLDKDCHVTAVPTICGYDHNQCCFNYIPFGALRVCLFHSYPLPFSFSTNQPTTAQGSLLGELHYISLLVVPALETRRRVKYFHGHHLCNYLAKLMSDCKYDQHQRRAYLGYC